LRKKKKEERSEREEVERICVRWEESGGDGPCGDGD
jgi:hypothetical protein